MTFEYLTLGLKVLKQQGTRVSFVEMVELKVSFIHLPSVVSFKWKNSNY